MTLILGLSGKKQSGKNTSLNWLFGNYMVALDLIEWMKINDKGQLVVPAEVDGEIQEGIFDIDNPLAVEYLDKGVWPYIKQYSFATPLKQFCMDVFGLTYEQVYGTNEQKDSYSKLRWEDMPGNPVHKRVMTAREVLQFFGTQICRRMYDNCWVDATIRRIKAEQSQLAVISDVRFVNEVEGIQAAGGKVIRLTRGPFSGQDEHESETALDNYQGFDAIIDNVAMSIPEQNKAVTEQLVEWGYLQWANS